MSIAGCLGSEAAEVRAALARLSYTLADAPRVVEAAGAVLGCGNDASLWQDAASGVVCVVWGDLYERAEMEAALGIEPSAMHAEVAGKAYLKWGETFPTQVDGEFCCAIWDGRQERLVLARDVMSRRSLFYAPRPSGLCFATEMIALIPWPGVDGGISDEMIARMFAVEYVEGRTIRRGIFVIPGGHVLVVDHGKAPRTVRCWDPASIPEMRVRDPREYAEALRAGLVRAVERRLPAEGLVGSHLSSGFDSSGVTALAAQALLKQNRPLVAYTSVPVVRTDAREVLKNRFDNEWPLAAEVAAMYPNIEHVAVPSDGADWWEAIDTASREGGGPPGFLRNVRWYHGILKDAHRRGLVTMLEGQAGNLTASYAGGFGLYDLRRKGRWLEMVRSFRRRMKKGERWTQLVEAAWMPSARVKFAVQKIRGKHMPALFELTLMREDFYRASGIPQRSSSAMGSVVEGDRRSGATWRGSIVTMGDLSMMTSMVRRAFGIRREDPTADRRLFELCLSIPDDAFAPGGVPRELYRMALRNDLPTALLQERMRGLQSSDFLHMFEAWLPQWYEELDRLDRSPSVGRYIDLKRMRKLLDDWPKLMAGPRSNADQQYNYTFGSALGIGRFLRQIEDGEIL